MQTLSCESAAAKRSARLAFPKLFLAGADQERSAHSLGETLRAVRLNVVAFKAGVESTFLITTLFSLVPLRKVRDIAAVLLTQKWHISIQGKIHCAIYGS